MSGVGEAVGVREEDSLLPLQAAARRVTMVRDTAIQRITTARDDTILAE
jgi:hypothetical protein